MTPAVLTDHPAKWNEVVLARIVSRVLHPEAERVGRPLSVLDPFAGVGRIHGIRKYATVVASTTGVELEPEWAATHGGTVVGSATNLPRSWSDRFDAVVTSPCYGNRMADHHDARDDTRRNTYRHVLGRPLSEGSAASLQWGQPYRDMHLLAIENMWRVVKPGGLIVVNVKNHVRKGVEAKVVEWWVTAMLGWGLGLVEVLAIPVSGLRHGENHDARVDCEHVIVTRRNPS